MDYGLGLGPQVTGAAANSSYYGSPSLGVASMSNPTEVASQFEAIFYRMFFQQMREGQLEEPLLGGGGSMQQLQAMQHDEMANYLGKAGHLGIKDMILSEIEKQGQAVDPMKLPNALGLLKPSTEGDAI